jgi:hypothetical protein
MVHVAPGNTRLRTHNASVGHDADPLHPRQIDNKAVITQRGSSASVATAAHCERQCVVAREMDASNDVGRVGALRDHERPAVDAAVPDAASAVEARIATPDQRSAQHLAEFCDSRGTRTSHCFPLINNIARSFVQRCGSRP